ncbi:MAG: T9SS type A sorting domain-containing protein, partial [Bacteroidota bacterium]
IQYISAIDKRTAWAVASDGSGSNAKVKDFTRTIDGGNLWVSGTINAANTTDYSSSMICAIDENTAWVPLFGPSGGGMIVKTNNGGETWTEQPTAVFSAPDGFPNIVHFWDENNGFCQGDPNGGYFELYTTTDGGITWTRVSEANIPSNATGEYGTTGFYAVFGDIIWFATNKGQIYKSTDKGYNWVAYQTPITDASFEISFRDADNGIIQKRKENDYTAYRTIDGGESWTEIVTKGNFYTSSFKYVPGVNMLISSGSDYNTPFMGISYSTDDGDTFTDYAEYYQNFQFLAIGAASEDAIWTGTFDNIWHYGDKPIVSDFSVDDEEICSSTNVTFKDESNGTPDTWSWNFGEGANPATATGEGPHSVSYSTVGGKTVTLDIVKGTDIHQLIKTKYISVAEAEPDAVGNITGEISVNAGETYTYSVTDQDNVVFYWTLPSSHWQADSDISSIEIYFDSYAQSGTLTVSASNGCGTGASSSIEVTAHGAVGISDLNENDIKFLVYPNPAKDKFSITNLNDTRIYIYNNIGSLMKTIDIQTKNQEIDISGFKTGIYYVKFEDNGNQNVFPFSVIE